MIALFEFFYGFGLYNMLYIVLVEYVCIFNRPPLDPFLSIQANVNLVKRYLVAIEVPQRGAKVRHA
jgi:hypothetical protein